VIRRAAWTYADHCHRTPGDALLASQWAEQAEEAAISPGTRTYDDEMFERERFFGSATACDLKDCYVLSDDEPGSPLEASFAS
jgi:hypothetical protein